MTSGRTHPPSNRVVVTQGDYQYAIEAPDEPPGYWLTAACLFIDCEVERVLGFLSPDRRWLWQDRRHFYESDPMRPVDPIRPPNI